MSDSSTLPPPDTSTASRHLRRTASEVDHASGVHIHCDEYVEVYTAAERRSSGLEASFVFQATLAPRPEQLEGHSYFQHRALLAQEHGLMGRFQITVAEIVWALGDGKIHEPTVAYLFDEEMLPLGLFEPYALALTYGNRRFKEITLQEVQAAFDHVREYIEAEADVPPLPLSE